jgi:ABC-type Fe3+ transport system permease subunit
MTWAQLKPFSQKSYSRVFKVSGWSILVLLIAVLIASPLMAVVVGAFSHVGDNSANEIWQHLASTVLSSYIINSLGLMVGVGAGVLLLGVSTAWLVTMCNFAGRHIFEWALLLPLAAPSYLLAYTYTDFLEYFGPIQSGLRTLLVGKVPMTIGFRTCDRSVVPLSFSAWCCIPTFICWRGSPFRSNRSVRWKRVAH